MPPRTRLPNDEEEWRVRVEHEIILPPDMDDVPMRWGKLAFNSPDAEDHLPRNAFIYGPVEMIDLLHDLMRMREQTRTTHRATIRQSQYARIHAPEEMSVGSIRGDGVHPRHFYSGGYLRWHPNIEPVQEAPPMPPSMDGEPQQQDTVSADL